MRRSIAFALVAVPLLAGCSAQLDRAPVAEVGTPGTYTNLSAQPPFDAATLELLVHEGINGERVAHGLQPLEWFEPALPLARAHSLDMAERDYFAHVNPDGEDPGARADRMGIECPIRDGFGENLVRTGSYTTVTTRTYPDRVEKEYAWRTMEEVSAQAVVGWMNSPGHRANILEPTYVYHAVGVYVTEDYDIYITDNFC